jgi:phosphoribosylanthranilate isomerase
MNKTHSIKLKVCGMRDAKNIIEIVTLRPDYMGFIFYPRSKRYIGEQFDENLTAFVPDYIRKVGVFVNENKDKVLELRQRYNLDFVQLHGSETVDYCEFLVKNNVGVIKSFAISQQTDLRVITGYEDCCDFLLFDAKVKEYGGSGKKFEWSILQEYKGNKPFFLSGGIDENDVETISKMDHSKLYGIDINSRFEISPGLKDLHKIHKFISKLQYETS